MSNEQKYFRQVTEAEEDVWIWQKGRNLAFLSASTQQTRHGFLQYF